jgi:hypothetical protein
VESCLKDDVEVWWKSLNHVKLKTLSNEEFEQVIFDKWSNAKKKDQARHALLYCHGCIQQENVIIFINPSCIHNLIHVDLAKMLKAPTKNMSNT